MKNILFAVVLIGSILACGKDDSGNQVDQNSQTGLVGKWQLTEVLLDPGDGSGVFEAVNSSKTIEFKSNGTISSNGYICGLSILPSTPSTGTYSLTDSTLQSTNCTAGFELNSSTLIVNYQCIEACKAKYEKL